MLCSWSLKHEEEISRVISQIKLALQGTQGEPACWIPIYLLTRQSEVESSAEQVLQLVNSIIQEDFLYLLTRSIHLLPFESRKDTQTILSFVLRFKPPNNNAAEPPGISYVIDSRPEVIIELCRGYEHRESAMQCGSVLREALKHEAIATIILFHNATENSKIIRIDEIDLDEPQTGDGVFWNFFPWIDRGVFEISTDAFTTFRVGFLAYI